eukprot:gb/GEZN01006278.1/.p1 GENE.gb/GEZN01006278.1/~~gb/GEZN01006278.1/.p1  ORF type:complete len:429 (+),score=29.41 gb/GEZN01006278.1/:40-1326(+)
MNVSGVKRPHPAAAMGKAVERPPSRRRFTQKPQTERELPNLLDVWIPESRIYTQMLNFERRIDASIVERQINLTTAPRRTNKILRLYLSTEVDPCIEGGEPSNWTLRIQGQLMEPEEPPGSRLSSQFVASDFVEKLNVHLDPAIYPPSLSVGTWSKAHSPATCDGWLFKRTGQQSCQAKISVYLANYPAQFKLSKKLSALLELKQASKANIFKALYAMIERARLRVPGRITTIRPNEELAEIIGLGEIDLTDIPSKLTSHLLPPDPVVIDFLCRVSDSEEDLEDSAGGLEVYDIPVDFPDRSVEMNPMSHTQDGQVDELEKKIATLTKELHKIRQKRDLLRSFCEAPIGTMETLIIAQAADVRGYRRRDHDMTFNPSLDQEHLRRADQFQSDWMPDAVDRYLEDRRQADVGAENDPNSLQSIWPLGVA